MDKICLYGYEFDIARIKRVIVAAGLEEYLHCRKPFPKNFIRDFPFIYRKIIGYRRLVYFLHVRKTAGSSFADLVFRGNNFATYQGIFADAQLTFDQQLHNFIGFDEAIQNGKEVFLCFHYNYGELLRSECFDNSTDELVTIIRNPLSIIISSYNFVRTCCSLYPDRHDVQAWKRRYGNNAAEIGFCDWVMHEIADPTYLLPYHTIFDIDRNQDLHSFLTTLKDNNLLVVTTEKFNAWAVNSKYSLSATGERLTAKNVNISNKFLSSIPTLEFLPYDLLLALQRDEFIYETLLEWS